MINKNILFLTPLSDLLFYIICIFFLIIIKKLNNNIFYSILVICIFVYIYYRNIYINDQPDFNQFINSSNDDGSVDIKYNYNNFSLDNNNKLSTIIEEDNESG